MIAAVKIISIGFDIDRKKIRHFPNFIEFWGYILCPGNVIMGPWCAYNDYLYLFNQSKFVSKFIHFLFLYSNIKKILTNNSSTQSKVIRLDSSTVYQWNDCDTIFAGIKLLH